MQNKYCSEIKSHSRIDVRRAIKIFVRDSDVDTFSIVHFCLKFLLHTRFSASLFGAIFIEYWSAYIHIFRTLHLRWFTIIREKYVLRSLWYLNAFLTTTHWIRVKFRSLEVWQEIIYPSLSREQLFIKRYNIDENLSWFIAENKRFNPRHIHNMQCIINILGVTLIFKFNAYFISLIQRVCNVRA